jgi:hypothetical protein
MDPFSRPDHNAGPCPAVHHLDGPCVRTGPHEWHAAANDWGLRGVVVTEWPEPATTEREKEPTHERRPSEPHAHHPR